MINECFYLHVNILFLYFGSPASQIRYGMSHKLGFLGGVGSEFYIPQYCIFKACKRIVYFEQNNSFFNLKEGFMQRCFLSTEAAAFV